MNTELLDRPIHTDRDLHQYWLALMQPLGFPQRRLYLVFIDDEGRAIKQLHEIDYLPASPNADLADDVMTALVPFEEFSFAVLLARPGRQPMDANDRAWARTILAAAERAGVSLRPLHFANSEYLAPFTGDDLIP